MEQTMFRAFLLTVVAVGWFACASPPALPSGVPVSRAEYGDRWPFMVETGYVDCVPPSCAVFRTGTTTYGLNGLAMSHGFQDVRPIWRDDPSAPGLKVNIGPMIDLALGRCK